jgi:outer membrane protein TolC
MSIKGFVLLGAALLAGCVTPPREEPHPRRLVDQDVGLSGAAALPVADNWWDSFQDPQLDRLIRQGLKDSPTLAQAQARVAEAFAQVQSAHAALGPKANLDASSLYQRAPDNYIVPPPLAGHTSWFSQA